MQDLMETLFDMINECYILSVLADNDAKFKKMSKQLMDGCLLFSLVYIRSRPHGTTITKLVMFC